VGNIGFVSQKVWHMTGLRDKTTPGQDQSQGLEPVKVLFLHTGGAWIRGSENALLMAMHGLNRSKVTPFLLCGNSVLAGLARHDSIESRVCRMPEIMIDGARLRLQLIRWAKALYDIVSFAKVRKIQVLYCNGGSTCQVGYYAGKILKIPVICHVHSPYNRRYILLYRLHLASKVICVSRAVENLLSGKQRFTGRHSVVYNGVDTDRFQPATERDGSWRMGLGLPKSAVVFGQV
jgi:L-malate glycosyltransferase